MITLDITQNYISVTGVMFLVTGALLLLVDSKAYRHRKMAKEQVWSHWLGRISIVLGAMALVGNWIAVQWFW